MRSDIIGMKDAAICAENVTADHLTKDLDEYSGGGGGTRVYGVYGVGGTSDLAVGGADARLGDGSGVGKDGRAGAFGGADEAAGDVFGLESVRGDGRGESCGRGIPGPGLAGIVDNVE